MHHTQYTHQLPTTLHVQELVRRQRQKITDVTQLLVVADKLAKLVVQGHAVPVLSTWHFQAILGITWNFMVK